MAPGCLFPKVKRYPSSKRRTTDLIERFGLEEVANSQARVLSGGERRKLEIARAMVTNPSLILLDEPFSGVDPIAVEELQAEIRRLVASGVSILITDHNVERTLEVADKAYILDHGKVIAEAYVANKQIFAYWIEAPMLKRYKHTWDTV